MIANAGKKPLTVFVITCEVSLEGHLGLYIACQHIRKTDLGTFPVHVAVSKEVKKKRGVFKFYLDIFLHAQNQQVGTDIL